MSPLPKLSTVKLSICNKEERKKGAMKRGWGTCGMFKAFNLTYLQILRAGMVYITLWYVHVPVRAHTGMCTSIKYVHVT